KAPISPLAERISNGTPDRHHPSIKRARQPVLVKITFIKQAPWGKNLRTEKLTDSAPPKTYLDINDVCRWVQVTICNVTFFHRNEEEEAICPSSTPSQSIALDERVSCVCSILQSCEL
ncbi:hypothetical protein OSTOST_25723, partial [Ostertagia ostertagi]